MASPKETGGPIVKTGPNSGKVRTRRKDGPWRRSVVMLEYLERLNS